MTTPAWLAEDQWVWWPGILERADGSLHDVVVACHRTLPTLSRVDGVRDVGGKVFYLGTGDSVTVTYEPDVPPVT